VPPLRQRLEEIPWLIATELAALGGLAASPRLVETCCLATWPGNLRELRSEIRAAGLAARAEGVALVTPEHLSAVAGQSPTTTPVAAEPDDTAPVERSREAIEAALGATRGNVAAAARSLGVHRNQVYRLMERYGIGRSSFEPRGDE
jgi:transcriptional regulator of acetoin/glycerol metabolism